MSEFGSIYWPKQYGPVASLSTDGASMLASTASTSTEGTDKLTFTTLEKGLYRVSTSIRIRSASTAGTSHVVAAQVAYTRGAAVSAADINNLAAAVTDADAKTLNNTLHQSQVISADAATTITITVLHTITGTGTGTYDLIFVIEKLS